MTTSEARKRQEEHDAAMLREAGRLNKRERVLRCLQRVYFGAEWSEADALMDALEDEELLR